MKKIIGILVSLMLCFTLTSCVTTATAQTDDMYDDVDISVVVTYGTPFYNTEGLIIYYLYRDMFYYPYFYHNRYYLHRYHRPLPPERLRMYRPVPRDFYRPNPPRGHKPHVRPNNPPHRGDMRPNNPPRRNGDVRPSQPNTRPNINRGIGSRPTMPNINRGGGNVRPTTPRTTNSHGGFGGARRR